MAYSDSIKEKFNELCKDPSFIQAYNDFNGTNKTVLNMSELFSVGTLFHFVTITMLNGQELLITDSYHDTEFNGKTYIASGDFTDISTVQESKELNNISLTVTLSNVRTEYINLVSSSALNNAAVKIDIGFKDPNTGAIRESFNIDTGTISKLTVNIDLDDNESKNETEVEIDSIWAVLEKSARNHCSDAIHRSYPGNENDTFYARIGKWNSSRRWTSVK
ncbi:hypothetical protein QVM81_07630 [Enterobacter rongchengensis]|uniref:DUF2163 domain-containing protein n=1 Tax=Enterobacter rongchengensis TaxID=3030999 RepID=A0ABV4JD04_9ENTR